MDEDEAFEWFCKGFLCSREGFNAEYAAHYLAPDEVGRVAAYSDEKKELSDGLRDDLRELFEKEYGE